MAKKRNQKNGAKLVCVLSDLHAGSTLGLLPPNFITLEGNEVTPNAIQQWLWQCWLDAIEFIKTVKGDDEMVLVCNGDALEGNHHRTKQIISPDVADHVNAAYAILEPVVQLASKSYMVLGTECHTGTREISLANMLGFERNPDSTKKNRAFDKLQIEVNGVPTDFRHHTNCTTRPYLESGMMGPMLAAEILEAVRNNETPPRVVCGAHRHRYGTFSDGHAMMVISAPWQALTRHGGKVVPHARTKPGIFLLDYRNQEPGELPIVRQRLYDAPSLKRIKV